VLLGAPRRHLVTARRVDGKMRLDGRLPADARLLTLDAAQRPVFRVTACVDYCNLLFLLRRRPRRRVLHLNSHVYRLLVLGCRPFGLSCRRP